MMFWFYKFRLGDPGPELGFNCSVSGTIMTRDCLKIRHDFPNNKTKNQDSSKVQCEPVPRIRAGLF